MKQLLSIFAIAIALMAFGQEAVAQKVSVESDVISDNFTDYDVKYYNDKKWVLGIEPGLAYQSSDVRNQLGWGLGLTLGKEIFGKSGSALALDWRARLLYTQTRGQDLERSYNTALNPALNGTYNAANNYFVGGVEQGVFHNHKTHSGEAGLELILTANRLRERTGWTLQGFGGVSANAHISLTDQQALDGSSYNWAAVDTTLGKDFICAEIDLLQDDEFESRADGYNDGPQIDFTPYVGAHIGYQLSPRFELGLEHKLTFTGTDLYDGQQFEQYGTNLSGNNDLHHFTSLTFRWKLDPGRRKDDKPRDVYNQNPRPQPTQPSTTPSRPQAPIVDITTPNRDPFTSRTDRTRVIATVKHVSGKDDITVSVNGRPMTSFSYSGYRDKLTADIRLQPGSNTVSVSANNSSGSDSESVTILFDPYESPSNPVPNPPTTSQYRPQVEIINPRQDPYRTSVSNLAVESVTRYVTSRNDVRVTFNGRQTTNFSFDPVTGRVVSNVALNSGNNTYQIEVRNNKGQALDRSTLILEGNSAPVSTPGGTVTQPPRVTITRPTTNPFVSQSAVTMVTATVTNVPSKSNITFTLNGRQSNDFSYNSATDQLSANVTLNEGNNIVSILATNDRGQDSRNVTLVYKPRVTEQKPIVTIDRPRDNPLSTPNKTVTVYGTVKNVTNKSQVTFTNNGRPNNFNLNGSSFSATVNLTPGRNTMLISATNTAGSDNASTVVIQEARPTKPPVTPAPTMQKPTVRYIYPATSPTTIKTPTREISAEVKYVTSKGQIRFLVNGRPQAFNYNASTGSFTSNVTGLIPGRNTLVISAMTPAGSASATTVFIYQEDKPQPMPPSVNILTPVGNPAIVKSSTARVTANILNATSNQVTVEANGRPITSWKMSGTRVEADVFGLKAGQTITVRISAKNNDGQSSDAVQIKYITKTKPNPSPSVPKPPTPSPVPSRPGVSIVQPASTPTSITSNSYTVIAATTNVTSKSQLKVSVNGKSYNKFTWDSRTKRMNIALTSLASGNNVIRVTASTSGGSATASTTLVVGNSAPVSTPGRTGATTGGKFGDGKKGSVSTPAPATPSIKLLRPVKSKITTSADTYAIQAQLKNVSDTKDIQVLLNGDVVKDTKFRRGVLTFTVPLDKGKNTVRIIVGNRKSRAQETIVITRR